MQRLKDARVTQVQLLFRLAKGGHGMLRAFVPHPAPPPRPASSFLFPLQTDRRQNFVPGAANSQDEWHGTQETQPQAAHSLGGVMEDLHAQSWESCVIRFDASLGCIVCSDLK